MISYLLTAAVSIIVIGFVRADFFEGQQVEYETRLTQTVKNEMKALREQVGGLWDRGSEVTFLENEPAGQQVTYRGLPSSPLYDGLTQPTQSRLKCFNH